MDVLRLVEDLEDMLEISNTIPLTGKVMLDKEETEHILEQIRHQIPEDIAEAESIKSQAETIIEDANDEAKQLVQAAQLEAQRLIDEDEIVVEANNRATEIMERAEEESTHIKISAREYVDDLLENTQVQLSELIKILNKNREELRN